MCEVEKVRKIAEIKKLKRVVKRGSEQTEPDEN
jgi:hypothetical protein